jgi:hypothetical protein
MARPKSAEEMIVPLSFEYTMRNLFGPHYFQYVGTVTSKKWRTDLAKIVRYLKISIVETVDTDTLHRSTLLELCETFERSSKNFESVNRANAEMIQLLVKVSFALVGRFPDNMSSKNPYVRKSWKLDSQRTVTYLQSADQKVNVLLDQIDARKHYKIQHNDRSSLHEILIFDFDSDRKKLIAWFKNAYPEIYCKVF